MYHIVRVINIYHKHLDYWHSVQKLKARGRTTYSPGSNMVLQPTKLLIWRLLQATRDPKAWTSLGESFRISTQRSAGFLLVLLLSERNKWRCQKIMLITETVVYHACTETCFSWYFKIEGYATPKATKQKTKCIIYVRWKIYYLKMLHSYTKN